MTEMAMTCEKFESVLPEYLEGDLTGDAKAAAEQHAKTCASCGAIVADIDRITREASALPAMRPSRELWSGIEERISAPVIPFAQPAHRVRRFAFAPMAAAAAALIVTTAGITYLATSRGSVTPPAQVAVATPKQVAPTVDSSVTTPPTTVASIPNETPAKSIPSRTDAPSTRLASNSVTRDAARPIAANANNTFGSMQADAAYTHEIAILERMVNSSSSGLDPATVQIVKKNLDVIDDAIAQSKAALAKDPASALLYTQMTRAMGKKVELLRTAASLTSGT